MNEIRVQPPVGTHVLSDTFTMEDDAGRKRFELEQVLLRMSLMQAMSSKLASMEAINADERTDLTML